jgi:integrase
MSNIHNFCTNNTDWLTDGFIGPYAEIYFQYFEELPNRDGRVMTRYNVNKRLKLAVNRAIEEQPSIANKTITPHILRHTTAMHLLQSGVPFNIIALWLGHESVNTTHRYVQADLAMKENALSRLEPIETNFDQFKAPDSLMAFLQTL